MTLFDRFRKIPKKIPTAILPPGSTVLGNTQEYVDPRIFIRNVCADAMLGEELDDVLLRSYGLSPVSDEGWESLHRDSRERISKVLSALPVIDSVVDTVLRVVVQFNPDIENTDPEMVAQALDHEIDVVRRCVIATLACLVDIDAMHSHLPIMYPEEIS